MKKFLYGLIAFMFILPISLGFVACKKTYTLNYMVDGKVYQSVQINSDQTIQEIEEPTKDGYDFVGWFISETAEDEYEFGKTIDSNINLYARWEAISYSIVYELNGGTNATVNKTKYTVEDAVTLAPATKDGFRFAGWYESSIFEGAPVVTIAKGTQGNKKFYANWEADNYTISYNLNGGAIDESANPTTYTYNSATITLANPTKTADEDYDYEFGGWYDNPDFNGEAILTIPEHSSGNKVLFAKWNITQSRLTINYEDINGQAVAEMYSAKVAVGQAYSVNSPVVTGYTSNQATVEGTMGTTKVMLTVVYTPVEYEIDYRLDGGTNAASNPVTYTILDNITFANPTKANYEFAGWYTDSSLTENTTGIFAGSTGSKVVYARWIAITYRITLKNYDDITVQVTYTVENAVAAPSLEDIGEFNDERPGYNFDGWKVASGAQGSWEELVGQPIPVGATTPVGAYGDVTLEAQYSVITYTISYNLDGGTIAENANPTSYTVEDETIVLANPTKAHYDFEGWYAETDTEHLVKITQINCANEVGNKSLVAYFTVTNYNINYHIDADAGETNNNLPQYTYFMPDINLNPAIKFVNDVEYTFIGWYDNPEFTGTPVTKIATNSEGDKDLYPKWELQISSAANLAKAVQIDNAEIIIAANITLTEKLVIATTVTIDLQEYTISATSVNGEAVQVVANGNLSLLGGNDGEIYGKDIALKVDAGEAYIYGGIYSVNSNETDNVIVVANEGTLVIYKGIFEDYDPSTYIDEDSVAVPFAEDEHTYCVVVGQNEIAEVTTDTELRAAAADENIMIINLAADIELTKTLTLQRMIMVNGQKDATSNYTLTGAFENSMAIYIAKQSRAIIKNINLIGGTAAYGDIAYSYGIYLDENSALMLDNSVVYGYRYDLSTHGDYPAMAMVSNSKLSGWSVLYTFTNNGAFMFDNCTLTGVNNFNGQSNYFATIVVAAFDEIHASQTGISLKNCTINVYGNGTAYQGALLLEGRRGNYSTQNYVMINDCTFNYEGNTYDFVDNGVNNTVMMQNEGDENPNIVQLVDFYYQGNGYQTNGNFEIALLNHGGNLYIDDTDNMHLKNNVVLSGDVVPYATHGTITIYLNGFNITGGKVVLNEQLTFVVDGKVDCFVAYGDYVVVETDNSNGTYSYTAVAVKPSDTFAEDLASTMETVKNTYYNQLPAGEERSVEGFELELDTFYVFYGSIEEGQTVKSIRFANTVFVADQIVKVSVGNDAFVVDKAFYVDNGDIYVAAPVYATEDITATTAFDAEPEVYHIGGTSTITENQDGTYTYTAIGDSKDSIVVGDFDASVLFLTKKEFTFADGTVETTYGFTGAETVNGKNCLQFYPVKYGYTSDFTEKAKEDYKLVNNGKIISYTVYAMTSTGVSANQYTFVVDLSNM